MFVFTRWFKMWYETRQLIKEKEAREAQRKIQLEKRDDEHTQALLLALHQLQRTMDPLIAAQVYNDRFCPLTGRLPEELLLIILDFLSNDAVALHCVRIVSRTFFRLLNHEPAIWRLSWYRKAPFCTKGESALLHEHLKLQFRRLLQRDGRCDNCKRWNNAHKLRPSDDCKFRQLFRWDPHDSLSFLYRKLHCYACHSFHDVCQFASKYQELSKYEPKRQCLGQQGSVQLCEHIQIAWASIKAHIDDWRQQRGGRDWQSCLNSFNIECRDASHDTRCTVSAKPTYPRARLVTGTDNRGSGIVILNLEWIPHSRLDALTLTADGRLRAPELRALFQRLRINGPADTLCPPWRPGVLPEMAFFSPSSCIQRFVYYKTGEDDEIETQPALFPSLPEYPWKRRHTNVHGWGKNGRKLEIRPHYPSGVSGTGISSQCLIISYEKDILICNTKALMDPGVKIIPTEDWLHAMDTRTYPHPYGKSIRPQCKEITCANYYLRIKDYYSCPTWPFDDKV